MPECPEAAGLAWRSSSRGCSYGRLPAAGANHDGADPPLSPGPNCGVALDVATPPLRGGNFWGAATGPGADPADAVCALVALAEPVVTAPLAAKEIRVRAKAAQ